MAAETIKPQQITKSRPSKTKITDLVINKGLTQDQTAQLTGYSQQRISQIISEAKSNPDNIMFRDHKDSAFEGLQAKIINLTSDEDIKKANLQQKVWAIGVLEDKVRNIRGLATEIHDVQIRALIANIQPNTPTPAQPELSTDSYNDANSGKD